MSERLESAIIGDIVATDSRAAGVFERFGIDFCCDGRRSLAEACRTATADLTAVMEALDALPPATPATDDDVTRWPVGRLIDHIVSTHHTYVRSALPTISSYLTKLEHIHSQRHPELARVVAYFDGVRCGLEQHLMKEEQVLFPYVRDLAMSGESGHPLTSPFGTVENPIRMMERDHREAAAELRVIRELTKGYTTPSDGCATYAVCMAELERFERDLHRHVHLENNVLFPKAAELERSFWRS